MEPRSRSNSLVEQSAESSALYPSKENCDGDRIHDLSSGRQEIYSWRRRFCILLAVIVTLCTLNVFQFFNFPYTFLHNSDVPDPRTNQTCTDSGSGALEKTVVDQASSDLSLKVPDKAMVLASYHGQNLNWTLNLPASWHLYRYMLDDPNPHSRNLSDISNDASRVEELRNHTYTVPRNQGREVMAYLSYIIDHYDKLPLFSVFLHGHDTAWHQIEHAADKLRALNLTAVTQEGYLNIRCSQQNRCRPDKMLNLTDIKAFSKSDMQALPKFWDMIFPDVPPPQALADAEGAQFAVSRDAIRSRSLEFWMSLRRPLERDISDFKDILPGLKDNFGWGLLYEHVWHVLFGMPPVHCIDEDYCRSTIFCGAITCDRYVDTGIDLWDFDKIKCNVSDAAMRRADDEQARAVELGRANLIRVP